MEEKVGVVEKGKGSIMAAQIMTEKDIRGKERREAWRRSLTRRPLEGKARRKREDGNGRNVSKKHWEMLDEGGEAWMETDGNQ